MKFLSKVFPIVLFVVAFLLMSKVIFNDSFPDFRSYYYNPIISIQDINPYLANKNLFTPSVYPPFIFIFFLPLSILSFAVAQKLWIILSIFALLISLKLLFKVYEIKFSSSLGLILSSLVFLSFPAKYTLGMGQINMLILLCLCIFIYYFNKSEIKAIPFLGLSLLLKFFPLIMPLYLILKRKWKALFILVVVTILGLLFSFIFVRQEINIYFYQKILPTLVNAWQGYYYNQSLSGVIVRAGVDPTYRGFIRGLVSIIILIFTFLPIVLSKLKDKFTINLEISTIITASLLLNSFSWQHHFVWSLVPFITTYFFIKKYAKGEQGIFLYIVLFISYLLISTNLKSPLNYPQLIQSHVFFGGLILLILQLFLLFRLLPWKPKNVSRID